MFTETVIPLRLSVATEEAIAKIRRAGIAKDQAAALRAAVGIVAHLAGGGRSIAPDDETDFTTATIPLRADGATRENVDSLVGVQGDSRSAVIRAAAQIVAGWIREGGDGAI